jgi:hypothetical protein
MYLIQAKFLSSNYEDKSLATLKRFQTKYAYTFRIRPTGIFGEKKNQDCLFDLSEF